MSVKFGRFNVSREPQDFFEKEILGHCLVHRTSFLCAKLLEEERELRVLHSGAGFYIGTTAGIEDDIPGEPISRDSEDYYETHEEAVHHLIDRTWTQRLDC